MIRSLELPNMHIRVLPIVAAMLLTPVLSGCDAVEPASEQLLVIEAFLNTDGELPIVTLREAQGLDIPYHSESAAVDDAALQIVFDDGSIRYRPVQEGLGRYRPEGSRAIPEGTLFSLRADWRGSTVTAGGRIPPPIRILDIKTVVAEEPVQAVLLDSLHLDSLQTGARSGYVYPVQVTIWWERGSSLAREGDASNGGAAGDSLYWIRTQLKPFTAVAPGVVELFFRAGQILREDRAERDDQGRRWTGVYLVPVDSADSPLPAHSVNVAIVRSDEAYARFASSRTAPERREPVSNVRGGAGIVAGISVDSLTIQIR